MESKILYELTYLADYLVIQIKQIAPYWILGTIVGSFISVYLKGSIKTLVSRLKKGRYNIFSLLAVALLGVASPVCMFGTIPIVAALGRSDLPEYLLAGYMVSSILLNPNLLLVTFSLGKFLGIIRIVYAVLGGIIAGTLIYIFYKKEKFFTFDKFSQEENTVEKKKNIFFDILKSARITAPYFLFGILVTALFNRYFPKSFFDTIFFKNQALSTLFMASLGVPVYVCGGGTIPLLHSWLDAGLSEGSAVAFMLSGPATKITNISALKSILKGRNIIVYLLFMFLYSIFAGFLTDIIIKI